MSTRTNVLLAIVLGTGFLVGMAADRWWLTGQIPAGATLGPIADNEQAASVSTTTYVCPMHNHIREHGPGVCPICGMDLVPVDDDPGSATKDTDGTPAVAVPSGVVNSLGVKTLVVARGTLAREIETMGMVSKIAATRNVDVTPGIPGRLEWVMEEDVGDIIEQGTLLYTVFSPERIRAQEEYLEAWDAKDNALLPTLWDALRAFHFSGVQIKQLEETREIERLYRLTAPHTGALIQRLGRPGDRVKPDSRVCTIGGTYKVDVNAEVFEREWGWLAYRQRATIRLPSVPGGTFEGIVERVNKSVNFKTRSLTARLAFATLNPKVKEGMVADVTIHAEPRDDVLFVPRDAVIRTADEARVIVALGEGRFRPVRVRTGTESAGSIEIVDGLQEGQKIVVSGQFLIDSESSLSASLRRIGAE